MLNSKNSRFTVVNAFAEHRFGGNPAGVFLHAEGLTDDEMQLIARQLNLVETVYVFQSTEGNVDRHLRYFTPLKELPLSGHPTVAAWFALASEGELDLSERTNFTQKTAAGIQNVVVQLKSGRPQVSVELQSPKFLGIIDDRKRVADVFGIHVNDLIDELPIEGVDTGLGHLIVSVKNLEILMKVQRNIEPLRKLCTELGLREAQLFCRETICSDFEVHTRNLCPREGIEDPACGTGTGALGAFLAKHVFPGKDEIVFKAEQGMVVSMPSVIEVKVVATSTTTYRVFVGGGAVEMLTGSFTPTI